MHEESEEIIHGMNEKKQDEIIPQGTDRDERSMSLEGTKNLGPCCTLCMVDNVRAKGLEGFQGAAGSRRVISGGVDLHGEDELGMHCLNEKKIDEILRISTLTC